MPGVIVVVPCYNEARRLDRAAFEAHARREGASLLMVNDGSRDATLSILEQLHRAHPRRLSYLHLARNGGKAEAVRQGMLLAIERGAELVGFWDADLATPLEDIEPFTRVLAARPEIQLVVGARLPLLGHRIERRPLRRVLGRVFANAASLALGLRIYDTQCGAKLFRVTPMLKHVLTNPFLTRWIFDVEILARMKQAARASAARGRADRDLRETIYELPLDAWRDVAGSAVKSSDFVKAIGEMAKIYWTYLRPGARPQMLETPAPLAPPVLPAPADRQQAA